MTPNSRSYLNRWTSPDAIIPDLYDPQSWDRFAYVRNNPVNRVDPDGHADIADWDGSGSCDRICMDKSRQNYLISKILIGSGKNGAWTADDWKYYNGKYIDKDGKEQYRRDDIWRDQRNWLHPEPQNWDTFALQVERLAKNYGQNDTGQFVKDFALVWGGISSHTGWLDAARRSAGGPEVRPFLNEGNQGLDPRYLDRREVENQSHHYTAYFFLGYHSFALAIPANYAHDLPWNNPGDTLLGNMAAIDGMSISSPIQLPGMIRELR